MSFTIEKNHEKWICYIAFVGAIIFHLLKLHYLTILPYIIIFFFLSVWIWEKYIKETRRIKKIIRKQYSREYDFNKEYVFGDKRITIIQLFPYIEGDVTKIEKLFLKYFHTSFKMLSGQCFREESKLLIYNLEEIFEIVYKVREKGYKNLRRVKARFDGLLEWKVNVQLDSIEFQQHAKDDPYYDRIFREIKADCSLFFNKRKKEWFLGHIRSLKKEIHQKKNIETYDLRRFIFTLESSISEHNSKSMNQSLHYVASVLKKYDPKDYLKLLTNLYGLNYDGKIKEALTFIKPYLIKYEQNRFSSLYAYVKNDSKLLYTMLNSYKKYVNYRIVKKLHLEEVFNSHLQTLDALSFPDRAERIESIMKRMSEDTGWHSTCANYQKYLHEFDTLREDRTVYIHEQYRALKKILAYFSRKFREDIKQKDGLPSAWAQFSKIEALINEYKYAYDLESFATLVLKFRGILESNHIKNIAMEI